ncbi:MAG: hypothetical protein GTO16_13210 [Candidatus Aminicenantes bacterium]|nr:hypothetical protein [Candidatus Aminicenantes bacterium]
MSNLELIYGSAEQFTQFPEETVQKLVENQLPELPTVHLYGVPDIKPEIDVLIRVIHID